MMETGDIDRQLQPNERLLWRGCPRAGFLLRPEQIAPMIVGASMLLGALWMLMTLLRGGVDWIGFVLSGVFGSVGLYLTFGILELDTRCRRSTSYAVTNRRIIIQSDSPFVDNGSVPLLRLDGEPQPLKIGADGTIHFDCPLLSYVGRFWGPLHRMVIDNPRLECLENPLRVYRVIRRAQRRLQSAIH
jgi:hypothetical protein